MYMKNILIIICSIILPVFSFNEITPKFCINCKFFTPFYISNADFNGKKNKKA